MAGGKLDQITAKSVADAFHAGDMLAKRIVNDAAEALSAGMAALVNAINPCLLILGGGIIEGMPEMVPKIEKGLRLRALSSATSRLAVLASELGNDAGIIGGAALAMKTFSIRK
jgi:glucokinase